MQAREDARAIHSQLPIPKNPGYSGVGSWRLGVDFKCVNLLRFVFAADDFTCYLTSDVAGRLASL
jgi:hypothetical protein